METGSWILTGALAVLVLLLLLKIHLLHRAVKEIQEAFLDRLVTDTNTLVDTSSYDPYMRSLAAGINEGLRRLRLERHRFRRRGHRAQSHGWRWRRPSLPDPASRQPGHRRRHGHRHGRCH